MTSSQLTPPSVRHSRSPSLPYVRVCIRPPPRPLLVVRVCPSVSPSSTPFPLPPSLHAPSKMSLSEIGVRSEQDRSGADGASAETGHRREATNIAHCVFGILIPLLRHVLLCLGVAWLGTDRRLVWVLRQAIGCLYAAAEKLRWDASLQLCCVLTRVGLVRPLPVRFTSAQYTNVSLSIVRPLVIPVQAYAFGHYFLSRVTAVTVYSVRCYNASLRFLSHLTEAAEGCLGMNLRQGARKHNFCLSLSLWLCCDKEYEERTIWNRYALCPKSLGLQPRTE